MFLAGITSVADWIGSNKAFFPPATGAVDLAGYTSSAPDRAGHALDALGWTGWTPDNSAPLAFGALFPEIGAPRPLQIEAERLSPALTEPGLVLIEAPMGEGKTEGALYLADHWTHQTGQQGLYVALPTQATSNQMFERVTTFLARRYPQDRVNLHLLHGQALLSERYEALRRRADGVRQEAELGAVYDDDARPDPVVAEAWFAQNKKQALLAPFAVGTIDQGLLAVLQTKHVFVRLFGLAGKTVILDEVHAYDAYMNTLLERLLEWLAALGCSVVLLSATLPAEKRRRLLSAYAGQPLALPPVTYPRMSVVSQSRLDVVPIATDPARRISIEIQHRGPGFLTDDLSAAVKDGGCAAVICNTVGRAQEVFMQLCDPLRARGVAVELFHARFPFGERLQIEDAVLKRYGKPERQTARPHKSVLVATQVIEQSLDLDFDLLVSEPAPADLILQRAGRLHRHCRDWRPARLTRPQLWLLEPTEVDGDVPRFGRSEFVYARYVLLASYLGLRDRSHIRLPDDVEELVEFVYRAERLVGETPQWDAALAESWQSLRQQQAEDCKAADCYRIRSPHEEDDILEDFCRQLDEDNPDVHRTHQAMTRLAEPTVNLVFLYERDGRLYLHPDGSGPVNLGRKPSLADAKHLLANAVTISHRSCVRHFTAVEPPRPWQDSGLLRFHRPAVLDADCKTPAGDFVLKLDRELGVVIAKAAGPGGIES
jgi:CRISPR-associated endonuclease/helicase Cas3